MNLEWTLVIVKLPSSGTETAAQAPSFRRFWEHDGILRFPMDCDCVANLEHGITAALNLLHDDDFGASGTDDIFPRPAEIDDLSDLADHLIFGDRF
jgi:hypothetical protein